MLGLVIFLVIWKWIAVLQTTLNWFAQELVISHDLLKSDFFFFFEVEGAFGGHPAAFETTLAAKLVGPAPSRAIWFPDLLQGMVLFMMLLIENKWVLILL